MNFPKFKLTKKCKCGRHPQVSIQKDWLGYLAFVRIYCVLHIYPSLDDDHFNPSISTEESRLHKSIVLQALSHWNSREY